MYVVHLCGVVDGVEVENGVRDLLKKGRMAISLPLQFSALHNKTVSFGYVKGSASRFNWGLKLQGRKLRAAADEQGQAAVAAVEGSRELEESVGILKKAAKTRKVPAAEILSAFDVIEKAKVDPSGFLETLGGTESPGRTWMLIFTAEKQLNGGRYFPITAVQRFDAAAKQIENGVFLGPIGYLTFEGRFTWKKRILAFIFERLKIKLGPLKTLEIPFGQREDREPSTKDPFFIWFYIDEEIAVARGRSGGTAFWCRCHRVSSF